MAGVSALDARLGSASGGLGVSRALRMARIRVVAGDVRRERRVRAALRLPAIIAASKKLVTHLGRSPSVCSTTACTCT